MEKWSHERFSHIIKISSGGFHHFSFLFFLCKPTSWKVAKVTVTKAKKVKLQVEILSKQCQLSNQQMLISEFIAHSNFFPRFLFHSPRFASSWLSHFIMDDCLQWLTTSFNHLTPMLYSLSPITHLTGCANYCAKSSHKSPITDFLPVQQCWTISYQSFQLFTLGHTAVLFNHQAGTCPCLSLVLHLSSSGVTTLALANKRSGTKPRHGACSPPFHLIIWHWSRQWLDTTDVLFCHSSQ
jgi:hypothetical protein